MLRRQDFWLQFTADILANLHRVFIMALISSLYNHLFSKYKLLLVQKNKGGDNKFLSALGHTTTAELFLGYENPSYQKENKTKH